MQEIGELGLPKGIRFSGVRTPIRLSDNKGIVRNRNGEFAIPNAATLQEEVGGVVVESGDLALWCYKK